MPLQGSCSCSQDRSIEATSSLTNSPERLPAGTGHGSSKFTSRALIAPFPTRSRHGRRRTVGSADDDRPKSSLNDASAPRLVSLTTEHGPSTTRDAERSDLASRKVYRRRWSDHDRRDNQDEDGVVLSFPKPSTSRGSFVTPLSPIPSSPLPPNVSRPIATASYFPSVPVLAAPDPAAAIDSDPVFDGAVQQSTSNGRLEPHARAAPHAASLDSRQHGSFHSVSELIASEIVYCQRLVVLVQVYYRLLPFAQLLDEDHVRLVVRNAQQLLRLHETLVQELRPLSFKLEQVGSQASSGSVAEVATRAASIFLSKMDEFLSYLPFCATHAESLQLLRSVENSPEWEAFERQSALSAGLILQDESNKHAIDLQTSDPASTPGQVQQTFAVLPNETKLRFVDYAIAPVQRICRYPLLFDQIANTLRQAQGTVPQVVAQASTAFRKLAEQVDDAKRAREREACAKLVASRLLFPQFVGPSFLPSLGPVLLLGALYVIRHDQNKVFEPQNVQQPPKLKYYGFALYETHLVVMKVRKRLRYEAREWLPLRLLDIDKDVEETDTFSYALRFTCRDVHFEVGATCAAERNRWMNVLLHAQASVTTKSGFGGQETLDDDLLSSIAAPNNEQGSPDIGHSQETSPWQRIRSYNHRSSSSPSLASLWSGPVDNVEAPLTSIPPSPLDLQVPLYGAPNTGTVRSLSRNRISATGAFFLGRTHASQRSEVDVRLADVFSEDLLGIRARASREMMSSPLVIPSVSTAFNKRPSSGISLGKLSKEWRRLSFIESPTSTLAAEEPAAEGAILGEGESLPAPATSSQDPKRHLKSLSIDTSVASVNVSSWRSRLRKTSSQSSLSRRAKGEVGPDVLRNNSVSSNGSSSAATGESGSLQLHDMAAAATETPPSSAPPSPRLEADDGIVSPDSAVTISSSSGAMFRRKSQMNKARSAFGNYFSKRIQSSPTLSGLFARGNNDEEAYLPGTQASQLTSRSTPHLGMQAESPVTAPHSAVSSPAVSLPASPELAHKPLPPEPGSSPVVTSVPSPSSESNASRTMQRSKSNRLAFHHQYKLTPLS